MTIEQHLQNLETLRAGYGQAIRDADPNLTREGEERRQATIRDQYKRRLDTLTEQFRAAVADAKRAGTSVIPKAPADTSAAWKRVEMLLDAGGSLAGIVAEADATTLHAIEEWGDTYLQAQVLRAKFTDRDAITRVVDPAALKNGVRQRWAQILDGYAPQIIHEGIKAGTAEAQFDVTARNLQVSLHGSDSRMRDARASLAAGFAATPPTLPGTGNNAA
ncbi:hypothetical protein ACX80I_00990 [Arthrobacter sp. MDT3-44]